MADATASLLCAQTEIEPIVWLRFNPDSFTINGVKQDVKPRDRFVKLFTFLKNYEPRQRLQIAYMYYSTTTENDVAIPSIFKIPDFCEALRSHAFAI